MVYWVVEKQAANQPKGEAATRCIGPFQSRKEAEQQCRRAADPEQTKNPEQTKTIQRKVVCDFA